MLYTIKHKTLTSKVIKDLQRLEAPDMGQTQQCDGVKHVSWYLNPPPTPLDNVEKQTQNNTHIKALFRRSLSPMSEKGAKETKQRRSNYGY